ncbi:MAG: 23S rRNA (adenine(2503)-C(2))-methyltransferase RlmN [Chloroflexota bacterium]
MIHPSDIGEPQPLIYDLDLQMIEETVTRWGEPAYRALQIWQGLYRNLWNTPEQFTSLSRSLRERMARSFTFSSLRPDQVLESKDGETRKTLFALQNGLAIETVLMRYNRRRTLCISSQAGCAMGCVFCATGQMGFRRNLSSGEIIEQVLYYARQLNGLDEQVTNIVVMGMGEPFHNYDETLAAIDRLNDPQGMGLGARRFTISTVGMIPAIRRFAAEDRQVNLAISLHAADDELRTSLLPINRKYPIDELLAACKDYVEATGRRITFEWALIRDVNDTPEQARLLAERLQLFRRGTATLCHVNVIPLNPTRRYRGKATTRERADAFKGILEAAGIPCTIRMRRGIDIQAGCGQLATQRQEPDPPAAPATPAGKLGARPGTPKPDAAKSSASKLPPGRSASAGKPAAAGKPAPSGKPIAGKPAAGKPAVGKPAPARPPAAKPAPGNPARPKPGAAGHRPGAAPPAAPKKPSGS